MEKAGSEGVESVAEEDLVFFLDEDGTAFIVEVSSASALEVVLLRGRRELMM